MDEKIINNIIEEAKKQGKVLTKAEAEEMAKTLSDENLANVSGGMACCSTPDGAKTASELGIKLH